MRFDIHIHHHMDPEQRQLLLDVREGLIMISAEVQAMLDKARQSVVLVNSVHAGMTALRMQVAELNQRIAEIPATQPATDDAPAVAGLSDEDRGAILEVTADLDRTITTLANDIPTNVSTVVAPKQNKQTPEQQQTHEEEAQAASEARPLPGTGDPQLVQDSKDAAAARTFPAADQDAARNAKNEPLPDGMVGSTPNSTATAPDNAPPRVVFDTTDGHPTDQHDLGLPTGNPSDAGGSRNPQPQPGMQVQEPTPRFGDSPTSDGTSTGSAAPSTPAPDRETDGSDKAPEGFFKSDSLDPDGKPATGGTPKAKDAGANQGFTA